MVSDVCLAAAALLLLQRHGARLLLRRRLRRRLLLVRSADLAGSPLNFLSPSAKRVTAQSTSRPDYP